jgi:hypothetical protein
MQSLGASTVSQVGATTGASVGSGAFVSTTGASVDEKAVSVELAESSPPHEASVSNPATMNVAPMRNEEREDWRDDMIGPLVVRSDYKESLL